MKKGIYTIGFAMMCAVFGVSAGCGDAKTDTEQQDGHEHGTYQCPMDCEAGKTYEEAGACPVCKMDLEQVENS